MKNKYSIPQYAYYHYDDTWTYTDYITIEGITEPTVIKKIQKELLRDENDQPLIQYCMIYDIEEANQQHYNTYEVPMYEFVDEDNNHTYSNYHTIESFEEPILVNRSIYSIFKDENNKTVIQYVLVYGQ